MQNMTSAESAAKLNTICASHEVSDNRKATLTRAIELGADDATLTTIRDTNRVKSNSSTIVLPPHRFQLCSRGRGWARSGTGNKATWGDKVEGGYEVPAGNWTVGGHDGFSRKGETKWTVKNITVGGQVWTIAN